MWFTCSHNQEQQNKLRSKKPMRLAILPYVTASSNAPILFYLNESTDCIDSTAATGIIVIALNKRTVITIVLLEKKSIEAIIFTTVYSKWIKFFFRLLGRFSNHLS